MNRDVIPKGLYCYDENGACPYWSLSSEHEGDGYCSFLDLGDWNTDTSLLWDQVKDGNCPR